MDKFTNSLSILRLLHFLLTFSVMVHGGINSLCNQTPYPELCTQSLIHNKPQQTRDENPISIRFSSLKFTIAQAEQLHRLISDMDTSSFNERAKSAWADCLELSISTLDQLNRSISTNPNNNAHDIQTWLSAAKANYQTCQNGFTDFNLSSNLQSYQVNNLSKLISNSLAINKAMTMNSKTAHVMFSHQVRGRRRLMAHGFPEWFDRKLVQRVQADVVVAQDGSGNFMTISEAVAHSATVRRGSERFVIYVKGGVYKENVEIKRSMSNLMLIGDGIGVTIVTGSRNVQDGSTTFSSATFAVSGSGFVARDMTFENTAGPQKHQAVALQSSSDLSVFYRCSFVGYQDTLYVHSQRQFYRDCDIYGTIDFIFGDAVVVLQNCNIFVRQPMSNQMNMITAQGRSDPYENTGIVIHNSRVQVTPGSFKTYLGRPWKEYSRTVFIKSSLDGSIDPSGWLPWSGNFTLSMLYYGEYMNVGPGAGTSGRVKWPGYHVITSVSEAGKFSVENFLAGSAWIPATGVPFTSGL